MITTIKKNWKTTIAGLVTLVCVGGPAAFPQYSHLFAKLAMVAGGIGLIAAPDARKE